MKIPVPILMLAILLIGCFTAQSAGTITLEFDPAPTAAADGVTNYIVSTAAAGSTNFTVLTNLGTSTKFTIPIPAYAQKYQVQAQSKFIPSVPSQPGNVVTNTMLASPSNMRATYTFTFTFP